MNDICYSGGAEGADMLFTTYALKNGHNVLNFSFKNARTNAPKETLIILSHEELKEADPYLIKANEQLKRRFPTSNYGVNCLLRRNYFQVKNTERVYAVAPFNNKPPIGTLLGGTAWAVSMAIDLLVPEIYVFNLIDNHLNKIGWYKYNYDAKINQSPWEMYPNIPKPKGKYTGIGSRTPGETGINAINKLYGE